MKINFKKTIVKNLPYDPTNRLGYVTNYDFGKKIGTIKQIDTGEVFLFHKDHVQMSKDKLKQFQGVWFNVIFKDNDKKNTQSRAILIREADYTKILENVEEYYARENYSR